MDFELANVDEALWVVTRRVGVPAYDFAFEEHFPCRHPIRMEGTTSAVGRLGATGEYGERFAALEALGVRLVHSPEEHRRCAELPDWYPLLEDLTPRSVVFECAPTGRQVAALFRFPVFVKGQRQTSSHQKRLCVAESAERFDEIMREWRFDPILKWQKIVVREYIGLRQASGATLRGDILPRAFEFRSFWWAGRCVGMGRYWTG